MDEGREERIQAAIKAVKEGMSKLKASKKFGLPRSTLQFRMGEKFKKPGYGPSTYLTKEEELTLINWITKSQQRGFPRRIQDLLKSVQNFIKHTNRETPFRDGMPGKGWYRAFIKRHPELTLRTAEAVTHASGCIREQDIRNWFSSIERELANDGLQYILQDKSRIFNGDETNFLLCPKNRKVIACRGSSNVYEVDQAPAKTSITVMFTFGADGQITPPMIIYPYKRKPPKEIIDSVPDSKWGIGYSDNGWMKSSLFYEYISNVFNPYLEENSINKPVILFVDGHKTHLTLQINELCTKLGIVLISLYPNSTRILQPADVAAFKPLKSGWQSGVLEWRRDHPHIQFSKENFAPLLYKVLQKYVKPSTIINGFRATGLFPWDANAIDYSKCIGSPKNTNNNNSTYSNNNNVVENELPVRLLSYQKFKQFIGDEMLQSFSILSSDDINDPDRNILYKIYEYFTENITNDFDFDNMPIDLIDENCIVNINDLNGNHLNEPIDKINISILDYEQTDDKRNSVSIDVYEAVEPGQSVQSDDGIVKHSQNQTNTVSTSGQILQNTVSEPELKCIEVLESEVKENEVANMKDSTDVEVNPSATLMMEDPTIYSDDNNKIIFNNYSNNACNLSGILCWPESPKRKNKRNIERMPYVITSEKWKEIVQLKDQKKKLEEKQKQERKETRERKKLEGTKSTKRRYLTKKSNQKKDIVQIVDNKENAGISDTNFVHSKKKENINILQNIQLKPVESNCAESNQNNNDNNKYEMVDVDNKNILETQATDFMEEIQPDFVKNVYRGKKFIVKGICYKCTHNISVTRIGRKCSACERMFHTNCERDTFKKIFTCNRCSSLK